MSVGPELSITRVRTEAEFVAFGALQVEYEESLLPQLRHDLPDAPGLHDVYAEPNAAFIAYAGDVAAGCIAVTRLDARTSRLQRLYVKPAYRKRGIARALTESVIRSSRESKSARLVLDTDPNELPAAYELYIDAGFVNCESYGDVDYPNVTFMELML